ncbi:MAG TPA: dipeptide epimerase [Gemmataceae bacterium]|nr:dipeptide epimerase [Gemmataceae bacterium]
MRVTELQAIQVRIPFKRAFRHASYTRTSTDNVVIRCVLENGTIGFGEGVPREYVTGETIDSAFELLKRSDLKSQLSDCADFTAAVAMAERLQLAPIPGDDRKCQGNGARCAVELAVLDAHGRHFGQSLSRVVQLLAPDLFEPKAEVRYSSAVTSGSTGFKTRLKALAMWAYGFHQLKVKVGVAGQDDVGRLSAIRKGVGRKMDIRIDANEAWPAAEAARKITELKPFNISCVEQPSAHEETCHFAEIRRQTGLPIMLDESLCGMVDAERAVAGGWCDLFNIRLSKCGGFIASLRLAQFAKRYGLGYQLGCQVGETAILSAAGRHFAASVKDLRYVEGSYDRHLVREALGTRDLTFGRGGKAAALMGGGLGIEIDTTALQRVTVRTETLA